jgi:hypothetical protein
LRDPSRADVLLAISSRADVLLAIWSTLALQEQEDEFLGTELGEDALHELFDDLRRDLIETEVLLEEDFEDWAIATG